MGSEKMLHGGRQRRFPFIEVDGIRIMSDAWNRDSQSDAMRKLVNMDRSLAKARVLLYDCGMAIAASAAPCSSSRGKLYRRIDRFLERQYVK